MDQTSGAANEVLKQLEEEKRKFEEMRKRAEIEDEARRKEAEERENTLFSLIIRMVRN